MNDFKGWKPWSRFLLSFGILTERQRQLTYIVFLSITPNGIMTNLVKRSKINTVLPTKVSGNMTVQNFVNARPVEFPEAKNILKTVRMVAKQCAVLNSSVQC